MGVSWSESGELTLPSLDRFTVRLAFLYTTNPHPGPIGRPTPSSGPPLYPRTLILYVPPSHNLTAAAPLQAADSSAPPTNTALRPTPTLIMSPTPSFTFLKSLCRSTFSFFLCPSTDTQPPAPPTPHPSPPAPFCLGVPRSLPLHSPLLSNCIRHSPETAAACLCINDARPSGSRPFVALSWASL